MKFFHLAQVLILPFAFAFTPLTAFPQQYTLQQCIETALKNNIRLKQTALSLQTAKVDQNVAKANFLPNLNASVSQNFNFGRGIDPVTNAYASNNTQSTSIGINSSVNLFSGLQVYNNYRLSNVNLEAAGSDIETFKNDLALQVATAFLQVMFAEDNLVTATSQLALTREQHEKTKKLVDAGKLPESAIYEFDAQEANDDYNVQVAQNNVVSAKLILAQLMEISPGNSFTIIRPELPVPSGDAQDVNTIYSQALNNRPEIKAATLRLQSATINRQIAFGTAYPRLTLSAGFNTLYSDKYRTYLGSTIEGYQPIGITRTTFDTVYAPKYISQFGDISFGKQLDQNFGKYVQLSLSVPIFNNLRTYGNTKKAEIAMMNQELNLASAKNNLLKSIQQAVTDADAAKARYTAAQKSLAAQNASFEANEKRYNAGLISFLDYSTSKNNKARAEVNLAQAKYDYILKSKVIDFYKGNNISF
jgi:outer membrane protein